MADRLPGEFSDLEEFVPLWHQHSTEGRFLCRSDQDMGQLRRFHGAMVGRLEEILHYLGAIEPSGMPGEARQLLELLMALPHAAMAIEVQGQPRVPGASFPTTMKVIREPR